MGNKRAAEPARAPATLPADPQPEPPVDLDRPRKELKPAQFFRAIASYPPSDGICTYIYRRWPVLDKHLVDAKAKTHIDKVAGPIEEAYLARHWGSGEYKVVFTDSNQPHGKTEICFTVAMVNEPDLDPVIEDMRELVLEHPSNKSFVKSMRNRGLMPKEGKEGEEMRAASDPATAELAGLAGEVIRRGLHVPKDPGDSSVSNKALDVMAEASRQAIQIVASNGKQPDLLDTLIKMREAFKSDSDMGMLKFLLESQQKQQELLIELMKSKAEKGGLDGELSTFSRLLDFVDRFGGRGRSGGGLLETLLTHAPAVLGPVMQLMQLMVAARTGAPLPPIAPIPNPALPINPILPATPASEDPMLQGQMVRMLVDRVVAAIENGMSGDNFAAGVEAMAGAAAYNQVAALGQDRILELLKSDPAVWARLQPYEAQLSQFVADFLGYGQPEPAAPQPEPAAPREPAG